MPLVVCWSLLTKMVFSLSLSVDFKLREATLCGRALQVVPIRHNADAEPGG